MNKRKKVFSLVFLLLIFGLTCYTIFSKNDLTEILHWIRKIQLRYLIFAMLLVPVFVCSESIIFKYLFKQFGTHVPIYHCCKYSFVGFFYSCITPSASGGQPMQLIYMSKDHLNVSDGSIVLIIVTIGYKMVLVIAGIITILFRKEWLYECMGRSIGLCYLGILLNVICIMTMFLLIFSKKIVPFVIMKGENLATNLKLLKHSEERRNSLRDILGRYENTSKFLEGNMEIFLPVLLISIFQRVILFFSTYLIYLGFGLQGQSCFDIILIQSIISLSVDMLPLPGGMGVSEGLFAQMYRGIFGEVLVVPAMLLSRWVSFYSLLIISGIVTLVCFLKNPNKE